MDWKQIRNTYPALQNRAYLNTAACGLVSTTNWQAVQTYWKDLMHHGGLNRLKWEQAIEADRKPLAQGIGVSPDQLCLLPNFTVGLNYVAQLLKPARSVLLVEGEYPSVSLPWELMNYQCHTLPVEANGEISIEKLEVALRETQAEILAISQVQWHTGFHLPLAELSALRQKLGIKLVIDATQSWCMIPVDLQATPVDVFIASSYKWSTAGFGSAIVYIAKDLWQAGALPVIGHGTTFLVDPGEALNTDTLPPAGMEAGHRDYASLMALGQGWKEIDSIGLANIYKRVLELRKYLCEQAAANGWEVLSSYAPQNQSGIISLKGEASWVNLFAEQGVDISFRAGRIRVSIHFYNDVSDIDRLMEVYRQVRG